MSEKLTQWSMSRLQTYELCPYRVKLQYLDKVADMQEHKSADRGSKIHEECEKFVRGEIEFNDHLKHFYPEFQALRIEYDAGNVTCEEEWGFDSEWNEAPWDNAWLRMKCDCVVHLSKYELLIVDYKTGQRYGNEVKHQQQLQLYAVAGLLRFPEIENVICELWYLDKNELARFILPRSEMDKHLKYFTDKGDQMCAETEFAPNPTLHSCRFCPYQPNKQGNCKFGLAIDRGQITEKIEVNVPEGYVADPAAEQAAAAFLANFK